ncbi:MAG: ABC transporter ATP-binding protein/permease [Bdellovibrionales bacterium]|nr:ABC transporter ATP-binding protein/permease [Bdellovibrionales bacterium]
MFSLGSLKSLKPYLWPHKKWLFVSLFMAIPLSALRSGPIPLVKYLVDDILVKKDPDKLLLFPLGFIGLYFLNLFVRFTHYYSVRIAVIRTNQAVREKLHQHLLSLSSDFFSEKKAGELISRVNADPIHLDQGISSINVLIREPITFLALFGYALYSNWKLTILTLTIVPALGFIFGKSGKFIKSRILEYHSKNAENFGIVQETIGGIRVLQLFNLQNSRISKFNKQMNQITRLLLRISRTEELASPLIELVTSFAIALILFFGGQAVLRGEMTSGDLLAFFASFGLMINPIRQLTDINSKLHAAAAAMDRINDFLSWTPKIRSPENALKTTAIREGIEFKEVSFHYPDAPERKVLDSVSFPLPLGTTVALVGQSGSGKSSVVQLLTRMYDVSSGEILVDGQDIRKLDLVSWRNLVSVVSQDVFLFHDSIYENILMGRPEATRDEVVAAAKKAYALDFIQRLPEGFDTLVGDRGVKLSGGERQRISIARAFLKNSPCLILDEATSNLDNESEKIVQQSLESLMEHRTTLMIAHRLSTIRNADQIIVLKQGKILETGTYSSLIKNGGEFQRLLAFTQNA